MLEGELIEKEMRLLIIIHYYSGVWQMISRNLYVTRDPLSLLTVLK